MKYSWLWITGASLLLSACSSKPAPISRIAQPMRPTSLSELTDIETEVFPLPNGNAYLVNSIDQQLFLLSGDRAKRVDDVVFSGDEVTVYSLPSGAAYLVSSDGHRLRLYYLLADKATLVQEGAITQEAMERTSNSSESFLWVQAQAALLRQRRTAADAREPDDPRE
jgi:hypothetical protein